MKTLFLFLTLATLALTACSDYGNKVALNENNDIYYKGKGITRDDALHLGRFLQEKGYFMSTVPQSVQLSNNGDAFIVRFVINAATYKEDKNYIVVPFRYLSTWLSEEHFTNGKVRVLLTDDSFNDITEVAKLSVKERKPLLHMDAVLQHYDSTGTYSIE